MASEVEKIIIECIDNNQSFIIEAGAGSGKTWSLVQALFYIIQSKGDQLKKTNRKVVCITYTNVAKEEIIERTKANELIEVKTIHDFLWDIIKPFQKELKVEILAIIRAKYNEQQNILSTSRNTTKKWGEAKQKAEKYQITLDELEKFQGKIEYREYYNRKKGIISHDDIIRLSSVILGKYNNILKIIQDTYPIIFIDEYQDTNQEIAEVILSNVKENTNILFGLFGDYNQQIYAKTIGKVDEVKYNLKRIPKNENYRCSVEVIELLNKLRKDIEQRQIGKEKHGKCLCYNINEVELDTEKFLIERICLDLGIDESTVKRLYLVTKSIAKRNGYLELHDLYDEENKTVEGRRAKKKDHLLKNKDNRECPFANFLFDIEELIELYQSQSIQKLLKKTCFSVFSLEDKVKLNTLMNDLLSLSEDKNIREIFEFVWKNNILEKPTKIKKFYEDVSLQDDFFATLMQIKYKHFRNLYYTAKKTSPFSTDHGTKGAEFDNVVCFIDDNDWKSSYSFNNYFDQTDQGKSRFEKTNNMFYVICSRAKYNLAIVFLSELNGQAKEKLKLMFGETNFNSIGQIQ